MLRVVKVNQLRTPEQRATVVYVGRPFAGWKGHVLGNPYKATRTTNPIELYRRWLLRDPKIEETLAALWDETEHGAKPLGCWCVDAVAGDGSPIVCHAQILAEMLRERFEGTGGQPPQ